MEEARLKPGALTSAASVVRPREAGAPRSKVRRAVGRFASRTWWLLLAANAFAQSLPDTQPLTTADDLSAQMVKGIDRFLERETESSASDRQRFWHRDFASAERYDESVEANRQSLRRMIGAVDRRITVNTLEPFSDEPRTNELDAGSFLVRAVRWRVFEGVFGEGLWLTPEGKVSAYVVALPDADQPPEMVVGLVEGLPPERQFARRLAENGCAVLVPVLINRQDNFSGNPGIGRFTNQPHREWIYRQAYELGRHIIGYEIQKIFAGVDFLEQERGRAGSGSKIGVAGYAEGGLLALYAAALDTRFEAVLVSGYFSSRQRLWEEPIYRNVFRLLTEFGDAELATLCAPRALIIEHSPVPRIHGPPKPHDGRSGAAPGILKTPDYEVVEREFERARSLLGVRGTNSFGDFQLISGAEGMITGPGSDRALAAFLKGLGSAREELVQPQKLAAPAEPLVDISERQRRQVKELEDFTQARFRAGTQRRREFFWDKVSATSAAEWTEARPAFASLFAEQVIGSLGAPTAPPNPRSRKLLEEPKWMAHEVMLDVFPDVFAWGYLLVPKDLKPGERRPVVVCQHGLEGLPADVIERDEKTQAFRYYKAFAARLADLGYVVFAPHNPYRGGDKFRVLQRKANPLGKSLFSVIIAQHQVILDWLSAQPFVDAGRIGFYGLSYGGKTAMRVPAVLDRYALSICSGDFNEWVRKNVSLEFPASYLFTGEYEMPEWNLGDTFNYAEMAALIAPRPFMVERGHNDGVGLDEWVGGEYDRVQRFYQKLGIADRTEIEFFDGPHTINGVGTFQFLRNHLGWPRE